MLTDPIADMFTRIRNANLRRQRTVDFPFSKLKLNICEKLKENNFLTKYYWDKEKRIIKAEIKYYNKDSSLHELKRISKPSQPIYLSVEGLKKRCRNHRIYLVSTSPKGILSHREAIELNLGGELIGSVS